MNPARLLVVRGPETGLHFSLDCGRVLLGSDPAADIPLMGRGICKRHCEVRGDDAVFWIYALSSEPSTFVNGVAVKESILRDGDRIRLGEVDLLFRNGEAAASGGHAMVAACSLFYLFRAMHGLELEEQSALEAQVREIAFEDLGLGALDLFVGGELADWAERLSERGEGRAAPLAGNS